MDATATTSPRSLTDGASLHRILDLAGRTAIVFGAGSSGPGLSNGEAAARRNLAAEGSSRALGSGFSWRGRSPNTIGTVGGDSGHCQSWMRMKKVRRFPSRCARVLTVTA